MMMLAAPRSLSVGGALVVTRRTRVVRALVANHFHARLVVDVAVGAFGVPPVAPVAALVAALTAALTAALAATFLSAPTSMSAAMVTIIHRRFPTVIFLVSIIRLNRFPVILFAAFLRD